MPPPASRSAMTSTEFVTMAGALVAAAVGSFNLWWQLRDRRDSFIIKWGRLEEDDDPLGHCFYVVNTGKHQIMIRDYGFIYANDHRSSLPAAARRYGEEGGEDHPYQLLPDYLQPREPKQTGGQLGVIDAVYAVSVTQRRMRLAYAPRTNFKRRMQLLARSYLGRL